MALGLTLGVTAFSVLASYPMAVLGVLLFFSGIELSLVTRDVRGKGDFFIVLVTTGAIIAFSSMAIGFVAGFLVSYILKLARTGDGNDIP